MSIARVIEISSTSDTSFENAVDEGIARACQTQHEVKSAWVKEQKVRVQNGKIAAYKKLSSPADSASG